MRFETYNRHDTFTVKLNQSTTDKILTIWEPKIEPIEVSNLGQIQHVIKNGFINSLRVKVKLRSIPHADLPLLSVDQSRTERLGLMRQAEWTQPRKHLNLYFSTGNGQWANVATLSLLRIDPFRQFDLIEYFTKDIALGLGTHGSIGISIENAGYGLLTGEDEVLCFGTATTEVVVIPEEITPIKQTDNYGAVITGTSSLFIPAIPNRKQVTLTNVGNADIFLGIGKDAELNKGICLKANGGSYEFNRSNHPFDLEINAISSGSSLLTGMVGL